MSGFGAWAASEDGTIALCAAFLALGLIAGYVYGWHRADVTADRDQAENIELAAADEWVRRVHDPEARRAAMAGPPDRSRRTSTAAFLASPVALEIAHEWEEHAARALAIANPDPSVTGWTQAAAEWLDGEIERRHADTDRWLAEHVYGVPYSADELWSGQ